MKISYNWLKQYLKIKLPPEEVADLLTNCGLEVEAMTRIESVKGGLRGIVTGEVITCHKHPNADRLSLTTVDIGTGEHLPIVCGAPNVREGQKVVVATIGARLYMGEKEFEIQKTKIRGEVSEGMICAEDELGLGASHEGIMVLDPDTPVGIPAAAHFDVEEDTVFEIGLTPNRTDAMCHIGVARDLMAVINNTPGREKLTLYIPPVDSFRIDDHALPIKVKVEDTEACPRYTGVSMTGITVKESPQWLRNRLNAIDVRPINNIVDISNFVLFETGQPLHIFNANEITGNQVIVRKMPDKTKFVTLDGVERELTQNDLMICNAENGMCIAGIFGGLKSGVNESTKNIFIESAHFNHRSIRKSSRYHGLQTDASFRFERGVDPNGTLYAMKRAALLIKEIAGGKVSSEIEDVYPSPVRKTEIDVSYEHISTLVGKEIDKNVISCILLSLGIEMLSEDNHGFRIAIPTYKLDVAREADVIEEILRIYGYNHVEIPASVKSSLSFHHKPDRGKMQEVVSDYLTANGFYEIMNNSLTSVTYTQNFKGFDPEKNIFIRNPISSELNVLRQTMLFGILESILHNINRRSQDLKLYEFGTIYQQKKYDPREKDVTRRYLERTKLALAVTGKKFPESWNAPEVEADIFFLKNIVINILQRLNIDSDDLKINSFSDHLLENGINFFFQGTEIACMGQIHNDVLKKFDIKQQVFYADIDWDKIVMVSGTSRIIYKDLPKFPEVRRDIALLLPLEVTFRDIERLSYQVEQRLLKSINLFDIYQGEGIGKDKKSYAVSFILQDYEKTLTDREIDNVMNKLVVAFKENLKAEIR